MPAATAEGARTDLCVPCRCSSSRPFPKLRLQIPVPTLGTRPSASSEKKKSYTRKERGVRRRQLAGLEYTFSCQTWKAGYDAVRFEDFAGILQEEAFHMVHQLGYARARF